MANSCSVKVVCRVRPLNDKEKASGSIFMINFPTDNVLSIKNKTYQYDSVLRHDSTQKQVYTIAAQPLVKDVLEGYNATIFAYGQTSSGKTHTMEGVIGDPELRGIIPRIVHDLFDIIYNMDTNLEFQIKVSYFELYMEKVRDLLDITKVNLPIHETKSKVPYVKGVTERFVTSPDEILSVIEEGKANRHVSVTNMNAHSSRSHAVFLINIKQENKETHQTLTGKLFLVDLAGSEKVEKTNAQGLTLDEAKTINKSLLALSNVISGLSDGKKSHIPYRDSKLTRVLQESLGGNARTTLIICCSPSSYNESETKGTLQFGERAKMIKNKVAVNIELTAEEWRKRYEKQKEECEGLKMSLRSCKNELLQWRKGVSVAPDEWCDTDVITGAGSLELPALARVNEPVAMATARGLAGPSAKVMLDERNDLYQQLDEKDEEIHKQTQKVESLTIQLTESKELLENSEKECESLKEKINSVESDLNQYQLELKEVMLALEELAVSYDAKDSEIKTIVTEKEKLMMEVEALQESLNDKMKELKCIKESVKTDHCKYVKWIALLFRDLNEIGALLGTKEDERLTIGDGCHEVTEDDFTRARVHMSNIRIEARTLAEQRDILEQSERDASGRVEDTLRELNMNRRKIIEMETFTEKLMGDYNMIKKERDELEEQMTNLSNEMASSSRAPLVAERLCSNDDGEGIQDHVRCHQQIVELQAEIASKECHITELQEQQHKQVLVLDTLQSKLTNLQLQRQDYVELNNRLALKDKVELEYSGLMDTVKVEVNRLEVLKGSLRDHLFSKLNAKSKPVENFEMPENEEVKFLEDNFDQLNRTHKKTLSSLNDAQRDLVKYQTMLECKSRRVNELEVILKDTKEAADREYRKLRDENESMKNNFMAKLKERERLSYMRKKGPTIVRPVARPQGAESRGGANVSREELLAVAGVHIVGHTHRSPLLEEK